MWKVEPLLGTIADHPGRDLWPSAVSSLPLALAMICQFELYVYTLLDRAVAEGVTRPSSLTVGKASPGECSGDCWIPGSIHGNTSSHPAFNAGHQVPSHEPDSDPTGQMDHMTLTGSWSHGWTVTGPDWKSAHLPQCLHSSPWLLALSLLLWKSVADMKP